MKLKYYVEWAKTTWCGSVYLMSEYSEEWDEKLNQILDTGDFEFSEHTMRYKTCEVWTANRFFAYGDLYSKGCELLDEGYRPKVSTMIRLAMLQDEWNKKNVKTKNHH